MKIRHLCVNFSALNHLFIYFSYKIFWYRCLNPDVRKPERVVIQAVQISAHSSTVFKNKLQSTSENRTFGFQTAPKSEQKFVRTSRVRISVVRAWKIEQLLVSEIHTSLDFKLSQYVHCILFLNLVTKSMDSQRPKSEHVRISDRSLLFGTKLLRTD